MFFSGPTTKRGGGEVKPSQPLRKKEKNLWFKKKLPEPHETQEKFIKKLYVMFSAGQYRPTEKGYEKTFF